MARRGDLTEADEREFRFAAIDGDGASFGGAGELRIPRDDTLCDRMLAGAIPNASGMCPRPRRGRRGQPPGVGADVGVPVRLGDERVYGSLCCVAHGRAPALAARREDARGVRAATARAAAAAIACAAR